MQQARMWALALAVAPALLGLAMGFPTEAAPVPQGTGVYEENFTSYTYKEYTDPTVAWDIFGNTLSLAPMSGRYQNLPAVAPDNHGGIYVIWEEIRTAGKNWDIYAQRVDEEGNRLWPEDVRVHQSTDYGQMKPALAVDMTGNAIIIWHDDRELAGVYAQKLSPAGERLWAQEVRVNGAPSYLQEWNVRQIAIATDSNDNAIVVWQGNRDGKWDLDIYAQKISPDGNRLWAMDIQVNDDGGTNTPQRVPDVAVDAQGNALVVWVDGRHGGEDIYAQRLNSSGHRLWTSDIPVSDGAAIARQGDTSVAMDAQGNGIIVWQYGARQELQANGAVYAQKVSPTGQRLWGSNVRVNQNAGQYSRDWPSVAVTASGAAVVVWANYVPDSNLYLQRLNPDGVPEWTSDKALLALWGEPYVGRIRLDNADRAYLVWNKWPLSASFDVFLQQIDTATGLPSWPSPFVRAERGDGSAAQVYPDVVAVPNGQATVVWGDFRRGDWAVYGQRVDAGGRTIWPTSYLVNRDPATQGWMPAAAGDTSGNVVVAWSSASGVMAQRINADGNRQWSNDLVVREPGVWVQDPDIVMAPDGSFYVVWLQQRTGDTELWDVQAQRINVNGQRLWSAERRVNRQDYTVPANWAVRPFEPAIAVDNEGYLIVAWYGNTVTTTNIYLQRLSPDGNPVWSRDISLDAHLPTPGEDESDLWPTNTAVALTAGTDIFVAWVDNRNTHLDIYMQKLDKPGRLLWANDKRANGDTGTAHQRSPALTLATNGDPVLVWNDNRNGPQDVYAQRFNPDGTPRWGADVKVNRIAEIWAAETNISRQALDYFAIVWRATAMEGNEDVYVQRLGGDGTVQWATDVCLTSGGHYYYPNGTARSKTVDTTPDNILQATLTADMQTHGGEAQFYLTNDGGAHWASVTPGVTHVFTTTGSDLRWQVALVTSPAWADNAAMIRKVRVEYRTSSSDGDDYEPDDACAQARPIAVNGAAQTHTFHQNADADWAWFGVVAGTTYIIQTANTQVNADTVLELYDTCPNPPLTWDDNIFGREARITWQATFSGRVYVKVTNHIPSVYGENTGYDLSVRTFSQPPVAVIVGGHNDRHELQANIDYVADMVYRTFLNAGVPKANIRYFSPNPNRDVDGNRLSDDIVGPPQPASVRDAIQDWSRTRGVGPGVSFYLILVDHGHYDQFLADGTSGKITATDLDLWLSNLETTSGADDINVIMEACYSGSFVDVTIFGPAEISGRNRLVITSTSSRQNAYPSKQGAHFSDAFWTAVGQNQDLKTAFEWAKQAVQATGLSQEPWLDDNGDAVADGRDGALARGRGLGSAFAGNPPAIDWVRVGRVSGGQATIQAQVRDDFGVSSVWAVVYPPDFVEPPPTQDGTTPTLNVPTAALASAGGDLYATMYTGFTQAGVYRVVVYAQDADGNQALPLTVFVVAGQPVHAVYVPLVVR